MSTIYVAQNVQRYDAETRTFVDCIDYARDLAAFERPIKYVVPPMVTTNRRDVVEVVRRNLALFGRDDLLVLSGGPSLTAVVATLAAARTGGPLRLLLWDRRAGVYLAHDLDLSVAFSAAV